MIKHGNRDGGFEGRREVLIVLRQTAKWSQDQLKHTNRRNIHLCQEQALTVGA